MNLYDKKHAWVLGGFEFLRADTTVEADPGSGGASFAADAAAGGELHPYTKMEFGASGTQTPVSTSNPLPVVQTGTPALPTGAATAARQDTGNTSLATLAGAVSGSEMQVDIVASAAIPVTDNGGAITVDDGGSSITVDGTVTIGASVTPGTGATNLGKAEDAAHSSGDVGVMALAVRRDSAAASSGTDGDYEPLSTDANGLLRVNASGANVPVTDAGGSLTVDDGGASLTVDGSVSLAAAIPAGTNNIGDVDILSIAAGDNNIGNVDIVTVPTDPFGANADAASATGSISAKLRQIAANGIPVTSLPASTNTLEVVGDVAHDAAVGGNPVLIGLEARTSSGTAVASGDAVRAMADTLGKQIILPFANPENFLSGVTAAITGTSDTSVIAAQGAGVRIYVTTVLVTNSHATVGTVVELKDNTTVIARGYAAALGGGFQVHFNPPLRLTANQAFQAANITTGSNTYVTASGYAAP
jgi:hypothetical protein